MLLNDDECNLNVLMIAGNMHENARERLIASLMMNIDFLEIRSDSDLSVFVDVQEFVDIISKNLVRYRYLLRSRAFQRYKVCENLTSFDPKIRIHKVAKSVCT